MAWFVSREIYTSSYSSRVRRKDYVSVTIAIVLRVNDGLAIAADSASTMVWFPTDGAKPEVANVYNHANKIANLYKGLPIAIMGWGAGNIGDASTSTLYKDLRRRLSGADPAFQQWAIRPDDYTIKAVAHRVREFMFDDLFQSAYGSVTRKPSTGVFVMGYSPGEMLPEVYEISVDESGQVAGPASPLPGKVTGMLGRGQAEAFLRLIMGFGAGVPQALVQLGIVPESQIDQVMLQIQMRTQAPLWSSAMPIQDAIDLVHFVADTAAKFTRFNPGWPSVGGLIEVATVTKHEGFRWISRKHFYERSINEEVDPWPRNHPSPGPAIPMQTNETATDQ